MAYTPQWNHFEGTAKQILRELIPQYPYAWAKVRSVDDGEMCRHFTNRCKALGHPIGDNGKRGTTEKSRDAVAAPNDTGCPDTSGTYPGLQVIDIFARHETPSAEPAWMDVTVNPETGQFYTASRWMAPEPLAAQPIPSHHVELGCGLFGGIALLKKYPDQFNHNVALIRDRLGATFVRVFFTVGGDLFTAPDGQKRDPWEEIGAFFTDPDHFADASRLHDAIAALGLAVQWTLFGSHAQGDTTHKLAAVCERFAEVVRGRESTTRRVDLVNEYGVNGFNIAELHYLYDYLRPRIHAGIPIGLSSPNGTHQGASYTDLTAEVRAMYDTGRGDFIPSHNQRGSAALYGPGCYRGMLNYDLPVGNNEPAGPDASAGGDVNDPFVIASDFMGSIAAGDAYYVQHSHWSVFHGHLKYWPAGPLNIDEQPGWNEIADALKALKDGTYTPGPSPTPDPPTGAGQLLSGQSLLPEQTLLSPGGHAHLHYQADGNLVVYLDGQPIWATHTDGHTAGSLQMQHDGNLVLYDASGPIRSTRTAGHPGAMVQLQDDGNFVVYDDPQGPHAGTPLWASASDTFHE